MDDDGHLLAQVEPHEPGLLVLALRQAHVPLLTRQALLGNHQPHLQAPGPEWGRWEEAGVGGALCPEGRGMQEGGQRSHTGSDIASSSFLGSWWAGVGGGISQGPGASWWEEHSPTLLWGKGAVLPGGDGTGFHR